MAVLGALKQLVKDVAHLVTFHGPTVLVQELLHVLVEVLED